MIQLPEDFDSIFRYIVVVSQRAEQLMRGAKPRSESRRAKPTLVAQDDVDAGQVEWRILTQEELDARRQEIVEQFRAEVSGEETAPAEAVHDVLPTGPGVEEVEEEGGKDDELMRLQRLLGMAGLGGAPADGDADTTNLEGEFEVGDEKPADADASSDDKESADA